MSKAAAQATRCMLMVVPLAVIIFGRDFALSISAFYFRYISLPPPVSHSRPEPVLTLQRTLKRYFDPSMPSAEVKPTQISKVSLVLCYQLIQINTALQLLLMGVTTVSPLVQFPISGALTALQWVFSPYINPHRLSTDMQVDCSGYNDMEWVQLYRSSRIQDLASSQKEP